MNSIRDGFIRCKRPNSPVGSHQWAEREEKWAISDSEIVFVALGEAEEEGAVEETRVEEVRDRGTEAKIKGSRG